MSLATLRQEIIDYANLIDTEAGLADVAKYARHVATAKDDDDPNELISFDADGTGYTAQALGDMLDERVAAMRRGEGTLTYEEYLAKSRAWTPRTV